MYPGSLRVIPHRGSRILAHNIAFDGTFISFEPFPKEIYVELFGERSKLIGDIL
jgi:hypothetical protein